MKRLPLELQTALENLEFWASVELRRGDDPTVALETFDELARRACALADPATGSLVRHRIAGLRRLVELRCTPTRLGHDDGDAVPATLLARRPGTHPAARPHR